MASPLEALSPDNIDSKLDEADFFCDHVVSSSFREVGFYFSAFVSAASSVVLSVEENLRSLDGFGAWWERKLDELKADPLATFVRHYRNKNLHVGSHAIDCFILSDSKSRELISEHLLLQMRCRPVPRLTCDQLPDQLRGKPVSSIAFETMKVVVRLVLSVYDQFGGMINPRQRYDRSWAEAKGLTLEEILVEMGYPADWLLNVPGHTVEDAWDYLYRASADHRPFALAEKYGLEGDVAA
jgi:hypothetical protein